MHSRVSSHNLHTLVIHEGKKSKTQASSQNTQMHTERRVYLQTHRVIDGY